MKKIIFVFGALSLALASCGGSAEETTGGTDTTATAETPGTPVDNSIIDPLKDDLSGVIACTDLVKSMNVYYEKEIQIVCYPRIQTEGQPFTQSLSASAIYKEPYAFGQETHASITFKTVPEGVMVDGKPYLVKGKITGIGFSNEIQIEDAELVELPADYKIEPFNPKAISSTAYYNPQDISANMMAWDKKMITVTGDYNGTTISKSYDQKELLDARVDVGSPSDDHKVGCSFATEEETTAFTASIGIVTIKGECQAELSFGSPRLENCVLVK